MSQNISYIDYYTQDTLTIRHLTSKVLFVQGSRYYLSEYSTIRYTRRSTLDKLNPHIHTQLTHDPSLL